MSTGLLIVTPATQIAGRNPDNTVGWVPLSTVNANFVPANTVVSASTFAYIQAMPSAFWTIVHGLGTFPSVTVTDSAGTVVEGDIFFQDSNTVTVTFAAAFAGSAYLI